MTTTSRLGLTLPNGAVDLLSTGDNVLAANYQIIDDAMGAKIAATVASIAAGMTYLGSAAFETTPLEAKAYSGTAWHFVGSNKSGKGHKTSFEYSDTEVTVTNETKIADCAFTAVSGRKYWCEFQSFVKTVTGNIDDAEFRIRTATGTTTTTTSSTLLESHRYITRSVDGLGITVADGFEFFPNVDNLVALGLYVKTVNFNLRIGTNGVASRLEVVDWGV